MNHTDKEIHISPVQRRTLTLAQLMGIAFGVVLVLALVIVWALSGYVEEKAVRDLAREEGRQASELVFQSLYSAMRKGWTKKEIAEIIERLNSARPELDVTVVRGYPVIRQFGDTQREIELRSNDPEIRKALEDGKELLKVERNTIRYIYPVRVKQECLACHTMAKEGDINGVVDIHYPVDRLKISLGFVMNSVIGYFTVLLIIIFIFIYFNLRFLVAAPATRIVQVMQDIIQNTDLNRRVTGHTGRITEFERLITYFNKLLTTVQDYQGQLEELSVRDPLTGLYNRRKFEEFLSYELQRARRHDHTFCLIMLDLDNFKHINDTFGHPIGDLALKELSMLLQQETRTTDILARLGGDEFATLLPETDMTQGMYVAERLRHLLAETPLYLPEGKINVHASFGLVNFPDHGETFEDLVIAMDVAMYKAKGSGKNMVSTIEDLQTDSSMDIFAQGKILRKALEEDRVIVHFQPIYSLKSNRPYAYEVLARIAEGEKIHPAAGFIKAADTLGISVELDKRVLTKGLEAAANLPDDIKLFFNLSARSLGDLESIRHIPVQTRKMGLEPSQIVLEITEREALPHLHELRDVIEEMRESGLGFALDDFGSGFSSFLYLKFLTVDYVKIEGSFVRHLSTDPKDLLIVENIHSMARGFGVKTVAEFVEDKETARILSKMGVDYGQGYYFGRPDKIS